MFSKQPTAREKQVNQLDLIEDISANYVTQKTKCLIDVR